MRCLTAYEIELDRRIIENIEPGDLSLEGRRLNRFDKPVVQTRYRLEGRSDEDEAPRHMNARDVPEALHD